MINGAGDNECRRISVGRCEINRCPWPLRGQSILAPLTSELHRSIRGRPDFGAKTSHPWARSGAWSVNKRRRAQTFRASVHEKIGGTSGLKIPYSDSMNLIFWFCKYSHFNFLTLDQPFCFFYSNLDSSLVHKTESTDSIWYLRASREINLNFKTSN